MDRRKTDRRNVAAQNFKIPDTENIFKILYKRKFLITIIIVIPVLFGMTYLKTKADIYRATSSVKIENTNLNLAEFQDIMAGTQFNTLTIPNHIEGILAPSRAHETITALGIVVDENGNLLPTKVPLEDLPIAQDNVIDHGITESFYENLHISQQEPSSIIEISYDSPSAQNSATIANSHAKYYVRFQTKTKLEQAERLNKWVAAQIMSLKEENIKTSRAVQAFKSEHGMVKGGSSEDLIFQQISDIAKQLSPIETKELDLRARVDLLKQGKSHVIREVIESQLIQSLKSRASIATQELQRLAIDFGNNHPDIVAAKKELSQINKDINTEILNIRRSIENELETAIKQKKLLTDKLKNLQNNADTLQEKQVMLKALQLEEDASHRILDNFRSRSEDMKSRIDFTRPDVTIASYAKTPMEPKGSEKAFILITIAALAAVLALILAIVLEMRDNGIQKNDDVRDILNLKLLGTLPKEKNPVARVLSKQRSIYIEEIKRIYIHIVSQDKTKAILFTSARIGEGKTLTALALASYLQSIGKKTIIIDANTIFPRIAQMTEVPQSPGLYELLSGLNTLNDVIAQDENGLSVIPSGVENNFSSDLLIAGRFKKYLEDIKLLYDYVIIDSASALNASDAEILAALSDETVIVAAWGKTPKTILKKSGEILRKSSKTTPYVILNKLPLSELKNT